ncbi:MAG: ZIP family metal transporter [Candidatus Aenigmarchaeota archaeon]|nr:ZIP family metal transporter [Candidatus Aenigmarchaeota archaeon]
MMDILPIIASTLTVSLISFIGILVLLIKEKLLGKILLILVAFSAGSLIGASFLHLLPEVMEKSLGVEIFVSILFGYVSFFFLEKFLLWHHCHKVEHVHTLGYVNLISDAIHNFIDGLIIAASFLSSFNLGIITTSAVIFHEVPQEIGDFGVLLYSKFKKRKALILNFIVALAALAGGIVGFFVSSHVEEFTSLLLPFAAGSFIYISSSDMIPEIKKTEGLKRSSLLFLIFILGIMLMFASRFVWHH